MVHSITDGSKRIVFHPQLLSDFKTICELGLKINAVLDHEPEKDVVTRIQGAWAKMLAWLRQTFGSDK
jgi:hypothetical protein